jgi:hypothetical protein
MGEQARQHLQTHYTWDRALAQLDAVYRELGLIPTPAEGD